MDKQDSWLIATRLFFVAIGIGALLFFGSTFLLLPPAVDQLTSVSGTITNNLPRKVWRFGRYSKEVAHVATVLDTGGDFKWVVIPVSKLVGKDWAVAQYSRTPVEVLVTADEFGRDLNHVWLIKINNKVVYDYQDAVRDDSEQRSTVRILSLLLAGFAGFAFWGMKVALKKT